MSEPRTPGRPNILWVSVEDINPLLGCYGDRYARTPNLDALAAEGIRYTNAHSMAPVCSVSRAAIITGVVSFALGTHHHRSTIAAPEHLRLLPAYLRDAGYFTSNCVKTDYNLAGTSNAQSDAAAPLSADAWDAWSGSAHWRQRGAGQPFFAVYNYTECHSFVTKDSDETILAERLTLLQPDDFHDPEQAPLPPYHPDIPEFRKAWSRYYDAVTQIDYHVGRHVAELQEDGLWDDTIVVFWADHGTGMLRAKHWGWEQGDHVPLIVRFPPRWQHLAPAAPGAVVEDPVTTLDLTASTLSMVGLPVPDYMHSRPVLCAGVSGTAGAVGRRAPPVRGDRPRPPRHPLRAGARGTRPPPPLPAQLFPAPALLPVRDFDLLVRLYPCLGPAGARRQAGRTAAPDRGSAQAVRGALRRRHRPLVRG